MSRFSVAGLSLMILTMVGCGKTNPASDYSNLKSDPVNRENSFQNQAIQGAACPIQLGSVNTFTQGQPGTVTLVVQPMPGVGSCKVYPVSSTSLPQGAQISQSPHDANTWIFSWTPPANTVTAGSTAEKVISVYALPTSTSDSTFNAGRMAQETFSIVVTKDQAVLSRPNVSGFPTRVNEGDAPVAFTVYGKDPSLSGVRPNIIAVPCQLGDNNEQNLIMDGHSFVSEQTSTSGDLNSTSWVFDSLAATKSYRLLDKANVNQVKVCLGFAVVSAVGNVLSPATSVQTYLYLTGQAPEFTFKGDLSGDTTPIVIVPGQTKTIEFTATIPDKKGVADITVGGDFLRQKGVVASPANCGKGTNNSAVQTCTITWDVPCNIKSAPSLTLYASNTETNVNGRPKQNRIIRPIEIDKTQSCTTSAPAAVAKPAAAPVGNKVVTRTVSSEDKTVVPPTLGKPLTADEAKKKPSFLLAQAKPTDKVTDDGKTAEEIKAEQKAHRTKAHKKPPMRKSIEDKIKDADKKSDSTSTTPKSPAPSDDGGPQ